ncbi:MAG TPA: DUF4253 domain-containing protein, partial [Kofleriaceae bacterium]|nr:DUF4253 domain-containing protein [Kofleriaceae bacterium]
RGERDRIAMAAVLVDMEYDLDEMAAEEPSAALSRARSLAAERFFARRAAEPDRPGGGEVDARAIRLRPVRAPRFDFASAGAPAVRVVLIAGPPGELLAHLRFGGWNDCPEPHEHVVVLEAWRRRHGAELVFAGHDTLELLVERPPVARSDLARLAREQSLYCADIVTQGTGDVAALASELSGAGSWFFWWD